MEPYPPCSLRLLVHLGLFLRLLGREKEQLRLGPLLRRFFHDVTDGVYFELQGLGGQLQLFFYGPKVLSHCPTVEDQDQGNAAEKR